MTAMLDATFARWAEMTVLLADVKDVARLDEAGKWLLECDTGEALLARLRSGPEGAGNGASH